MAPAVTPPEAAEFVRYWHDGGMPLWFGKQPELDRRLRERFVTLYERAAYGELAGWSATAEGALALVLLLDQFPRNAFRGSPRAYATDARAREVAAEALERGFGETIAPELRRFLVLPFGHSEHLADQDRAVQLTRRLIPEDVERAMHHRDIVRRFGRFPHRNAILGRRSTVEEERYLADGGYRG